eukprot:3940745-Rhodomonas_salina.18
MGLRLHQYQEFYGATHGGGSSLPGKAHSPVLVSHITTVVPSSTASRLDPGSNSREHIST